MENKAEKLTGGVTEAMIENWKKQYGSVHEISVPLDNEGTEVVVAYFKKPDLKTIGAAAKFAETDPIKSGLIMFDNCWLGGDERMKENEECKVSAVQLVSSLFVIRVGTIKNL
jgi:hypothetical protein